LRRYLSSALCLLLAGSGLLGAFALRSQQQVRTRGLDLGTPLNRPNNLYGTNIQLLDDPDPAARLSTLKGYGFGWVRQTFDWEEIDWAQADSLAESTRANGLVLVAALTGERPPDPVAFAEFAKTFAARYKDSIDYYQIWDEPNLELGWAGPPNVAEYARLLQTAHTAVHEADPAATVILGGLAPTIETGPKNISDVLYLRRLYELGAQPYFDAAAGKPYGFNVSPYDRTVDGSLLNFSRLILLREEMIAHGDGEKFLWASNFGWNTRPSIWGQVTVTQQAAHVRSAYQRAVLEWPWAGPLFLRTPDPDLPPDDPDWGFELIDLRPIFGTASTFVKPGRYDALYLRDAGAVFEGAWEFSDLGADLPRAPPAGLTFNFDGSDLAVTVRRADYRAYLYVTIDGQPANALPRDSSGAAYLILTSPDLQPHTDTILLASGLAPGLHTVVIRADRGWDQWAIAGFTVGPSLARPDYTLPVAFLLAGSLALAAAALVLAARSRGPATARPPGLLVRIGDLGQTLLSLLLSLLLYASAWLTWGSELSGAFRRYGDAAPLAVTVLTAGLFYYSPFFLLTLASLAALFILFYLRPDLALPLIAFFIPFYLLPRPLWDRAFSMVEICTLLAVAAALLRAAPSLIACLRRRARVFSPGPLSFLDLSVLAFTTVAFLTIFVADIRGVAIREFRVVVLDSALFYFLLRLLAVDEKGIWRVADFFLLGAVVVALYGLSNLISGQNLITAEGGVARIRSVYGSPNNLGLFLGRAIPIAAAVALLGGSGRRPVLYGLALIPLVAAAIFSFSRGALLLGIPAALAIVGLFWGGRRAGLALVGMGLLGLLALIPLSRHPRFAGLLSISSGTGFFRINVWRSAWAMFLDRPLLGVGLDNFLYAYRGRYILPEAWEEPNLPHAHNIVLDALTRTGLLGLAALLVILAAFFKLAFDLVGPRASLASRLPIDLRALAIGLLASMVNFMAHGMVDTGFWFVDLGYVFMMTLGLMAGMSQLSVSSNKLSVSSDQLSVSSDLPSDTSER
jgi:O-antigen ligase